MKVASRRGDVIPVRKGSGEARKLLAKDALENSTK
jgi:hypothetical protein